MGNPSITMGESNSAVELVLEYENQQNGDSMHLMPFGGKGKPGGPLSKGCVTPRKMYKPF